METKAWYRSLRGASFGGRDGSKDRVDSKDTFAFHASGPSGEKFVTKDDNGVVVVVVVVVGGGVGGVGGRYVGEGAAEEGELL